MIFAGYLMKHLQKGHSKNITYIVPFGLKHIEYKSDAILNGCHQLPHTVLVGWVFFGPPGGGEGAIQFGDEPATGSCWWWESILILVVEV